MQLSHVTKSPEKWHLRREISPNNRTRKLEPPATNEAGEALRHELTVLTRGPGVSPDRELLTAYAASAAPNSLRAFRADITAYDTWCHARAENCLPASP